MHPFKHMLKWCKTIESKPEMTLFFKSLIYSFISFALMLIAIKKQMDIIHNNHENDIKKWIMKNDIKWDPKFFYGTKNFTFNWFDLCWSVFIFIWLIFKSCLKVNWIKFNRNKSQTLFFKQMSFCQIYVFINFIKNI